MAVPAPVAPAATSVKPTYTPLTESHRFHQCLMELVSPVAFVGAAAGAGIGQWRDSPHEWGQGGSGYGYRYASAFAQHVTMSTLTYGSSMVFQDDNRYIKSGRTGTGSRIGYAIETTFLARRGDGTRKFSASKLIGLAGAAAISRAWQPHSTATARDAAISFGASVGGSAGMNVIREFFWPRKP